MRCLQPRFLLVKDTGKDHRHSEVPLYYRDMFPAHKGYIQVPCGKCIACLRNRQNAMVSRLYAEATKRNSLVFVTLTYDQENLPLAETTYRASLETGEIERVGLEYLDTEGNVCIDTKPRIIHGHRGFNSELSEQMRSIKAGRCPRYIERDIFTVDGYRYFSRVTPSVNREDVRLWLKSGRIAFLRAFGRPLTDFSYACVSEYGPKTCRPHYHICFMGLPLDEVNFLVERWHYGRQKDVKEVKRLNADGTDGFRLASAYIGKYITKGCFECPSVKDKTAQKPRLMQSLGLGKSLADSLRNSLFAFDYVGMYNPETLFSYEKKRKFTPDEVLFLVKEISKRFSYTIGYDTKAAKPIIYPVPRIIRERVFTPRTYNKRGRDVPRTDAYGRLLPYTVYRLVKRYLSNLNDSVYTRKFEQFLRHNAARPIDEVCCEFDTFYASGESASLFSGTADYLRNFYNNSIF